MARISSAPRRKQTTNDHDADDYGSGGANMRNGKPCPPGSPGYGKGGSDATHSSLPMETASNKSFSRGAGAGKQTPQRGQARKHLRDVAGNYKPGTSASGKPTSGLKGVNGGRSGVKSAKASY